MNVRDKDELVAGILLTGFGTLVIYEARDLPYVSEFGPGPGFFPLWIGIGIVLCSLSIICLYFWRGAGDEETAKISTRGMPRALSAWLMFFVAIAFLPLIGFALSVALLTAFLIVILDGRSFWIAFGVALGLAVSFHLLFTVALGVSLPAGPWGF
jgi:putative tricarboxylic transport membrane protein